MLENIRDSQQNQHTQSLGSNKKRVYPKYTCVNCRETQPQCGFYINPRLNRGHLSWCVACCSRRSSDRRKLKLEGIEKLDGRKCRPRMTEEERLQRNRDKARKSYYKNLEKNREYNRIKAREYTNPEKKRRSMLKSKYGLTPEAWHIMFDEQGRKCAICESTDAGAKSGWNTDHCHKSGLVRFILCAHCNRGLGAFKDSPDVMRRAAKMLEDLEDRPVESIKG